MWKNKKKIRKFGILELLIYAFKSLTVGSKIESDVLLSLLLPLNLKTIIIIIMASFRVRIYGTVHCFT